MKVLITGVTGFVGSHLAEFLIDKDHHIIGTYRWRSNMENIDGFKNKIELFECDVNDSASVANLMKKVKPDQIFHLAAQTFVKASWAEPAGTIMTNVLGALNIFEAVRSCGIDPRILLVGSSEEYGLVYKDELPVKETNQLRPLSPYAVSKISQDHLGYQYFKSYNMKIIRTRAFNQTGPRRADVFADSDFAKQIVMIEKGLKKPVIEVGNLNTARDFTDIRDMVRAYWLAINKCDPGEVYNIASGKIIYIRDILDMLIKLSGVKVEVRQEPDRIRPSDVEILQGDSAKFREKTGWKPKIPIEDTLSDLLDYWREKIKV